MNITKTKTKTTLTVTTTLMELKTNLEAYQNDMIAEMVSDYRSYDGGPMTFHNASKVAAICFHQGEAFYNLVEKTNTCWVDTPRTAKAWIELVITLPYIFGLTDEVVTEDIEVVTLVLDGCPRDISGVITSI